MNKLQRSTDGQTIKFIKLHNSLRNFHGDVPHGVVNLSNGQKAYWRLIRSRSDLKKGHKHIKQVSENLTGLLTAMVASEDFNEAYGLIGPHSGVQSVGFSNFEMSNHFSKLLTSNVSKVNYSSTYCGPNKPRIENIQACLGATTFFNAVRGVDRTNYLKGITGKIYPLVGEAFHFGIHSPIVDLTTLIGQEQVVREVMDKLSKNLPHLGFDERDTVFAFDGFDTEELTHEVSSEALRSLLEKHGSKTQSKAPEKETVEAELVNGELIFNEKMNKKVFLDTIDGSDLPDGTIVVVNTDDGLTDTLILTNGKWESKV